MSGKDEWWAFKAPGCGTVRASSMSGVFKKLDTLLQEKYNDNLGNYLRRNHYRSNTARKNKDEGSSPNINRRR